MPVSPLCLVQEGAGPFNPTLGGIDVAAGASVSVKLADVSGVTDWFLAIVGTDELSTDPVLTGVNPINNKVTTPGTVVTFTFPGATGSAVGFLSTVTGVGGPVSTNFGTYSLINGSRVGFVGETREGEPDFGWATKLNPLIRAASGGGADNFSYKTVNVPIVIPEFQQMTVHGGITVNDSLDLCGELNLV